MEVETATDSLGDDATTQAAGAVLACLALGSPDALLFVVVQA